MRPCLKKERKKNSQVEDDSRVMWGQRLEVSLQVVQPEKPKGAAHGESWPWKVLCLNWVRCEYYYIVTLLSPCVLKGHTSTDTL